jgi:hypothetical protein
MRILLYLCLFLLSFNSLWSQTDFTRYTQANLLELERFNWHPIFLSTSDLEYGLGALSPDGKQVLLIKSADQWEESKYKMNTWYDLPKGSAYYSREKKLAIYLFELDQQGVRQVLKDQILHLISGHTSSEESKKSTSWSNFLIPTAHAAEECLSDGSHLSALPQKLTSDLLARESEIWDMLTSCGSKVIQDTLKGFAEMVTDPLKFIGDAWSSIKGLSLIVSNFTTLLPEVYSQLSRMSARQLFDVICPVTTKLLVSLMSGKLALDGAKIATQMLKEIKLIQQASAKLKKIPAAFKSVPKPKLAPLTQKDGERFLMGTKVVQKEALTSLKNGELLVGGKPLNPSTNYTGILLDDGRLLLRPRTLANHNELVAPGDKVATAFELMTNSKGKVQVIINQSGTFQPPFSGMKSWLDWWSKTQSGAEELPFRMVKFPGSE